MASIVKAHKLVSKLARKLISSLAHKKLNSSTAEVSRFSSDNWQLHRVCFFYSARLLDKMASRGDL
jgi:hypothetical protein